MCWVRPGGQDGPLFNYKRQGAWGVHIWIALNGRFFVRITKFGSHAFLRHLSTDKALEQGRWYHVAATYDSNTGVNSIYVDGVLNKTQNIGTGYRISTNDPAIRMGVKIGDRRLFNGAISQMGIYNVSLTGDQIRAVIKQGGNNDGVFIPMYMIITLILILVIINANQSNYDHNKLPILDTFIIVNHLYFLTRGCFNDRTSERLQLIHRKEKNLRINQMYAEFSIPKKKCHQSKMLLRRWKTKFIKKI